MLFKLSETIEQVKRAGFSGDAVVYIDKSGKVVYKDVNDAHVIASNKIDFKIGMSFIFCFAQNKLEVYKKDKLIKEFEGLYTPRPFFDNGDSVVLLRDEAGQERYIGFDEELQAVPYNWKDLYPREIKG